MKSRKVKLLMAFILVLAILGSGIFIYYSKLGVRWEDVLHHWMHQPGVSKVMGWIGLTEETVLAGKKVYWCPMHPQVRRNKPGLCPICSMQLVAMKEEEGKNKKEGSLLFTSQQIQQAGVRFATVKRLTFISLIETTGRVDVDERRLKTISAWAPGRSRIDALYVNFTGATVRKGEPLLSIYNPELLTTQEEYLMLLKSGTQRMAPLLETVKARFKRWGITDKEINKIRKKGIALESLTIYSPISGTVIERMVNEGQYVKEGQPLLKLADLSKVWIYGDVYENELPFIKVGAPVEISVQGNTITGKVDFVDPVVQTDSRTVRVRFEASNKKGYLKPGMFASVRVSAPGKDLLAVPESAVLLTGRRAIVMVSEGNGVMRPVEVKLGRKWLYLSDQADKKKKASFLNGDERYHEVLSGLDEGQQVVSSANFLIAAEAQFQGALKKIAPPSKRKEKLKLADDIELAFAHILKSYENIRKTLALDNSAPAKKAAARLIEDIDTTMTKADGDVKKALEEIKVGAAGIAKGTENIEKTRRLLASISQPIISLITRYGLPSGVKLRAFTCPMTKNNEPWLQPGKTVENPYMGQKMSTCGIPLSLMDKAGEK